jgi:hypothetical protein
MPVSKRSDLAINNILVYSAYIQKPDPHRALICTHFVTEGVAVPDLEEANRIRSIEYHLPIPEGRPMLSMAQGL